MFKKITIQMASPICDCDAQDLGWGIESTVTGWSLIVECKSCLTYLRVPNKKFVASFELERDYPNGRTKKRDEARVLSLVPPPKDVQ